MLNRRILVWLAMVLAVLLGIAPASQAQRLALPRGEATQAQLAELSHVWMYPPGIYRFVPAYNDLCLGVEWATWPEQPYAMQLPCGAAPDFAVMPIARAPDSFYGYYTFRAPAQVDGQGRMYRCATVARGVIVGSPRIDFLPCDLQLRQSQWKFAGAADQTFSMSDGATPEGRRTFGIVRIRAAANCWTIRGSSRDVLGNVVSERCADLQNQAFSIQYVGPITSPGDLAALREIGWRPGPAGEAMRLAKPVRDIDLPGGDYASEPTANDYGETCAARCASEGQCYAFTWTPAAENQPAMCWLKDRPGSPKSRSGMYSAFVGRYTGPTL